MSGATAHQPAFAHASEAELARILDFYQVRWEYEPDTFPIGWSMTGDVVESFAPDFYLPDLDLYVELTTLKQKLVRKKNRKLRRLRELYPDVRIKLFYARDFRALLLKFGRLALLDDLTGTTGQATPPRTADRIVSEAGVAAGLGFEKAATIVAIDAPGARPGAMADAEDVVAADRSDLVPVVTHDAPVSLVRPPSPPRGRRRGRRSRRRDGASTVDAPVGSAAPSGAEQRA